MMVVTIARAALVQQLEAADRILARKVTIPVLNNILVSGDGGAEVVMSATDLEVSVRSRCAAQVSAAGAFTVPGRKLLDLVRTLPEGEVRLDASETGKVAMAAGQYKAMLQTLPAADFPTLPTPPGEARVVIPRAILRDLVRRTRFAVTTAQEGAYFLHGAMLEVGDNLVRMVATDGHRLAKAEAPIDAAYPVIKQIVPKLTLDALWPLLDGDGDNVGYAVSDSHLFFEFGDRVTLISRRMEAQFPAYAKVIPAPRDTRLTVPRGVLSDSLRRALLVGNNQKATLEFGADTLRVSSESADVGGTDDMLGATYAGPPVKAAVNASYVANFLDVAGADHVTVEAVDDLHAMVWRPASGGEYMYVVMPMRV